MLYDQTTGMVAIGANGERFEFLDVPAGHKIALINATTNTRISPEIVRPDDDEFVRMPPPRRERTPAEEDADWPVATREDLSVPQAPIPKPSAPVLHVGPTRGYPTLKHAVAGAREGDTIEVDSGSYPDSSTIYIIKRLTIKGVGEPKPKLSAPLITRADVTVESLHFEGCKSAAIRSESGKLLVSDCLFRNNQSGVMCDASADGSVIVSDSEFSHNNVVDISASAVKELIVGGCMLQDAGIGPQIKSRAGKTSIISCTVAGHVDLPEGKETMISNSNINGTVYP